MLCWQVQSGVACLFGIDNSWVNWLFCLQIGSSIPVVLYCASVYCWFISFVVVIWLIQGLLSFLSAPLVGALSDVWGRKFFLLVTVFFTCAPIPLIHINTWWYFAMISISGVFAVTFSVVFAYVADVTEESERSAAYGLVSTAHIIDCIHWNNLHVSLLFFYLRKGFGHICSFSGHVAGPWSLSGSSVQWNVGCGNSNSSRYPWRVLHSSSCARVSARKSQAFIMGCSDIMGTGGSVCRNFCLFAVFVSSCCFCFQSRFLIAISHCFQALKKVGKDQTILMLCVTVFLSYLPEAGQYSCFFVYLQLVSWVWWDRVVDSTVLFASLVDRAAFSCFLLIIHFLPHSRWVAV